MLDPSWLAAIASELAGRQAAKLTREAYAGVYRTFCEFLGADAGPEALTPETVRAYRDQLERDGRLPATIAKHLSALRTLASELGVERARDVRGQRVACGEPRALTAEQYARLLRMPDRRSTAGRRDLALLHLLGTAGLRRAEACALLLTDVDERRHASDGRLRRAIPRSTSWWVTCNTASAAGAAPSRSSGTHSTRSPPGSKPGAPAPTSSCSSRCPEPDGRPPRWPSAT